MSDNDMPDKTPQAKRPIAVEPAPEAVMAQAVAAVLPPPQPMAALPAPSSREALLADSVFAAYREALASLGRMQSAVAFDMTALALELSGLAQSNLTAAGDSATALLKAKSVSDAVEIQLGFVRCSLDALAQGSTRLGEIGLRLASDATKPVLGRFAAG